ncbi:MAG: hypothetical protein NVSMB13_17180 [Mycobacteriales bacterium]
MRRLPYLLAGLFLVLPLAELYVLVQVGHVVGVLPAIGLLLGVSVLGGFVVRREGARAWRAFRGALAAGRVPSREVADGAAVVLGGALLLTPGFLTDALGLVLLAPPSRAVVRRLLTGWLARRLPGGLGPGPAPRRHYESRSGPDHRVIEGERGDQG